jgi:fructosamine-3-kinase
MQRLELRPILEELKRCAGIDARQPEEAGRVEASGTMLRLASPAGALVLKVQPSRRFDLLEAEAAGLDALRDAGGLAVPAVHACGRTDSHAFLALEWISFAAPSPGAESRLGKGLARQHRSTSDAFGWHRDNAIGLTAQRNSRRAGWIEFFGTERLGFQLELAAANGLPRDCRALGERLLARLDAFFADHEPAPSLLHGDLWGGNWGADARGVPYVFDPAVYFGDREADLAMTRLFGGFGAEFYRAYRAAWPLPPGAEARIELYNSYHLLNHFNIFGSGYLSRVRNVLERLNAGC